MDIKKIILVLVLGITSTGNLCWAMGSEELSGEEFSEEEEEEEEEDDKGMLTASEDEEEGTEIQEGELAPIPGYEDVPLSTALQRAREKEKIQPQTKNPAS